MKTVIVLAVHGSLPRDFPRDVLAEYFALHMQREHAPHPVGEAAIARETELEKQVRAWPRTAGNDPFWDASRRIAAGLSAESGCEVIVGFNEFCAPDVDQAIDEAMARHPDRVVVVTPMLTRGGEHAERDIPAAVNRANARHPDIPVVYAWPFSDEAVARLLASRVAGV